MDIFRTRLRELRKKQKISQEDMAIKIGVAHRSYRRYETGEAEPGISTVIAIADVLDVSLDYLTGRTEE